MARIRRALSMNEQAAAILCEAVKLVQTLDPVGVATRTLRECLLVQVEARRREHRAFLREKAGPRSSRFPRRASVA